MILNDFTKDIYWYSREGFYEEVVIQNEYESLRSDPTIRRTLRIPTEQALVEYDTLSPTGYAIIKEHSPKPFLDVVEVVRENWHATEDELNLVIEISETWLK